MNDFWKKDPFLAESLAPDLERVEALIAAELGNSAFQLSESVSRIARSNGKLLRPAFLILGSRFAGHADQAKTCSLAAALELLHIATLIHDDIIDESPMRRGQETLHTSFGTKVAVLAGDWILARSFMLASSSAGPENAQALSRLVSAICAAEIGQDLARFSWSRSERQYLRTVAGKTAALFSLSLHAGAVESGAQRALVQKLRRAGWALGMAFQMIDDILDFESTEDVIGKPVARDLSQGICTLPLVYALRDSSGQLQSLLGARPFDEATLALILSEVANKQGIELARQTAKRYTARALAEIRGLPEGKPRDLLSALVSLLLERVY